MSTIAPSELNSWPGIVIDTEDHRMLAKLAHEAIDERSTAADDLLRELDRASIVPPEQLPLDAVRMGSSVHYRNAADEDRVVTLVHPDDAFAARAGVSVLTPVGAALIGLRKGQSINWLARDGRRQMLTVLRVTQPSA